MSSDTIFALSSGRGRAGIAVIRLSGDHAGMALEALTGKSLPAARRASVRRLYKPGTTELLDEAMVLWLPGPGSFTGEDMVELHVHGGLAVLEALTAALLQLDGMRSAEPGEFSRRAFEAGRMDLTAAEGINDLINARTSRQRELALRQLGGGLGAVYARWRTVLVEALARLEAEIDFSDEDLPAGLVDQVTASVNALSQELTGHLHSGRSGERIRDGIRIVILGAPNAGKSSLLNCLAEREAAIVSEVAGTTRDAIEVEMDLGGFDVLFVDTAGLRQSSDRIEQEGVRRALNHAREADMRLHVMASDTPAQSLDLWQDGDILIHNKSDLSVSPGRDLPAEPLRISALTGDGVSTLVETLTERVTDLCGTGEQAVITRVRHRHALEEAVVALDRFNGIVGQDIVLAAEDLRMASRAIGRVTGTVDVEDILDVVFSEFCIGK